MAAAEAAAVAEPIVGETDACTETPALADEGTVRALAEREEEEEAAAAPAAEL
jgi:hypothetical protein